MPQTVSLAMPPYTYIKTAVLHSALHLITFKIALTLASHVP
jgi:hypothetical protein